MHTFPLRGLVVLLLVLGAAPRARADRLITNDGRILEVKKARVLPDGVYQLVFESTEITCPAALVASVEIEGDMSDYVPENEDEKKKLAQGFVRYRGKWLSKPAFQAELQREADARRARTEELAARASFHDGWEQETKHFQLKTNTSPELLDYYGDLLEAYYDLMDQRFGIKPSPALRKTKMRVNVFKSHEDFLKLTGNPPNVLGTFNFVHEELEFFHDYQEPGRSDWVALHEGTHLLTYLIEPQAWPQIWINEGVADYFGSSTIRRDKKGKLVIEPGQPQIDRVLTVQQAIKDGKHVPLDKLFFIAKEQYQGFEYAHGWSFVYFLNSSQHEAGFKKFFKDFYTIGKGIEFTLEPGFPNQQGAAKIVAPAEVKRVLLDRLGVKDLARLEQEWLAFVSAIPIDAPMARFKRGLEVLYGSSSKEQLELGGQDIEAAIAGGVEDPRAHWARGIYAYLLKGDRKQCLEALRTAVELAPLQASFRSNLAQILSGLSLRTGGLTVVHDDDKEKLRGTPDELAEAKDLFGLASELEPENDYYRDSLREFLALYDQAR